MILEEPILHREDRTRSRILILYGLGFLLNLTMLILQIAILGNGAAFGLGVGIIISAVCIVAFVCTWKRWHMMLVARIGMYSCAVAIFSEIAVSGGMSGYFGHSIIVLPVISALVLGIRETLIFTGVNIAAVGVMYWLQINEALPPFELTDTTLVLVSSLTTLCTMAGCTFLVVILARETQRAENRLRDVLERQFHLANHDSLTGLKNRAAAMTLLEGLNPVLDNVHIFMLDLDGFKAINDTMGHGKGDATLKRAADALKHAIPDARLIARLGGDEFLIVTNVIQGMPVSLIGELITNSLHWTEEAEGVRKPITVSVGSATYPAEGRRIRDLLAHADEALYAAKRAGKSRHCIYEGEREDVPRQTRRRAAR